MASDLRFTIKHLPTGTRYVLQVRKSCNASIAQSWLAQKGITVMFKRQGWWYEADWGDSPEAQAIAPLLQARAACQEK